MLNQAFLHQSLTVGILVCLLGTLWVLRSVFTFWKSFLRSRRFRGDLLDGLFASEYRQNGPTHALYDQLGRLIVVHTIDPQNLHAILTTSWGDWRPPRSRVNTLKPLAQKGLLLTDGEDWHRKRKLVQRNMGTQRAKDAGRDEEHMRTLFDAIGDVHDDGWTDVVDLLDLFQRLALDMSTSFLLGMSADSQAAGLREDRDKRKPQQDPGTGMTYNEAYETIRTYLSWRSKLGSLYWMADSPQYRHACATLNHFADRLIAQAISRASAAYIDENGMADGKFRLIDNLVRDVGDPVEIRNIILDLFIAGQNMRGTMAAWVFAQLEHHPEVFRCVREEVLDKFGTEGELKEPVTWSSLKACSTMQHVILETLRMYPLLANVGRNAKCDTVLPRGGGPDGQQPVAVPKGATVTCNVYLMHRGEEAWGSDACQFRPDRWVGRKLGPEYAPFGGGPRVCIGQQLTMTEISLLLVRMMQRFSDIQAPQGQDNLVKGYRAVLAPKNGVKVRLRRA
ncbi:hypothetical protein LTR85_011304 [Meristemomyces frigidus]|nr:hypothetical protein LTR85_011304 [Meristemomyces frigidus]